MTVIITLNSVKQQISRFKSSTEINKQIINEDNLENNKINSNNWNVTLKHQFWLAAVHARVYCLANTAYEIRKRSMNQKQKKYQFKICQFCVAAVHAREYCLANISLNTQKINKNPQTSTRSNPSISAGFNSMYRTNTKQMSQWNCSCRQVQRQGPCPGQQHINVYRQCSNNCNSAQWSEDEIKKHTRSFFY